MSEISAAEERLVILPHKDGPWYARLIEMGAQWLSAQSTTTVLCLVIIAVMVYGATVIPRFMDELQEKQSRRYKEMMESYDSSLKQQNVFHEKMIERVTTSFDREVTNVKELVRELRAQR